ncbi:hypothetical protein [Dethiobacter alkaliphilus]|uniref:hypothetical protein n=1 Tax=Dethiobacter alkaliphilus TaxID=427926 RepID=UPI002226DA16|nr:hypothetical protein [Dethiobacter alkaliphilus]MCW3491689.1 hypothetical protein [Dethiobacter alkaliphilus]
MERVVNEYFRDKDIAELTETDIYIYIDTLNEAANLLLEVEEKDISDYAEGHQALQAPISLNNKLSVLERIY